MDPVLVGFGGFWCEKKQVLVLPIIVWQPERHGSDFFFGSDVFLAPKQTKSQAGIQSGPGSRTATWVGALVDG